MGLIMACYWAFMGYEVDLLSQLIIQVMVKLAPDIALAVLM